MEELMRKLNKKVSVNVLVFLLMLSVLISTVTYLFWGVIEQYTGVQVFYIGDAMTHFIDKIFMFLVVWFYFNEGGVSPKRLTFVLLLFAFSNLCDELFFDPKHLGWNELVFAFLTIIFAFRIKK